MLALWFISELQIVTTFVNKYTYVTRHMKLFFYWVIHSAGRIWGFFWMYYRYILGMGRVHFSDLGSGFEILLIIVRVESGLPKRPRVRFWPDPSLVYTTFISFQNNAVEEFLVMCIHSDWWVWIPKIQDFCYSGTTAMNDALVKLPKTRIEEMVTEHNICYPTHHYASLLIILKSLSCKISINNLFRYYVMSR